MNLACVSSTRFSIIDLDTNKIIHNKAVQFKYNQISNNKLYAINESSNIVIIDLLDYSETIYSNDLEFNSFILHDNKMYFHTKYDIYRLDLSNNTRYLLYRSRSIIKTFKRLDNYMVAVGNNSDIMLFENDIIKWKYRSSETESIIKKDNYSYYHIHLMRNGNVIVYNDHSHSKNMIVIHNATAPSMSYVMVPSRAGGYWCYYGIYNIGVNRIEIIHSQCDGVYWSTESIIGTTSIRFLYTNAIDNNELIHYKDDDISIFGAYQISSRYGTNAIMKVNNTQFSLKSAEYEQIDQDRIFLASRVIRYKDRIILIGRSSIMTVRIPKAGEYGLITNELFSLGDDGYSDHFTKVNMKLIENSNKIEIVVEPPIEQRSLIIDDSFDILDMF